MLLQTQAPAQAAFRAATPQASPPVLPTPRAPDNTRPTDDEVATCAYYRWLESPFHDSDPVTDWLLAEQDLINRRTKVLAQPLEKAATRLETTSPAYAKRRQNGKPGLRIAL